MSATARGDNSLPASRLAAELAHSTSVRRAEVQLPYRLLLKVSDDGLSRTNLKTIRQFGWVVSGFTIRSNSVSVVRTDRTTVGQVSDTDGVSE